MSTCLFPSVKQEYLLKNYLIILMQLVKRKIFKTRKNSLHGKFEDNITVL